MGKKVMEKEKRSKEKNWRGESHTYRYYSNAAVLRHRPTNEKCLTMQTRFYHWDDPMVGIRWYMTVESVQRKLTNEMCLYL
jgi:hypothetical protein